jgi:transposase
MHGVSVDDEASTRQVCPPARSIAAQLITAAERYVWSLDRIAAVIERLTEVRHHPAWVWALLRHRLGWTIQRPKRRATELDQIGSRSPPPCCHRWNTART